MNAALRFSKCQYPGICNSCAKRAEYIITAGIHTIKLCGTCARELRQQIVVATAVQVDVNTDHMKEVSHDQ